MTFYIFPKRELNTTVTNASVNIEGYNIFRLDRLRKKSRGVYASVKTGLKVKVLKDLTGTSNSGAGCSKADRLA